MPKKSNESKALTEAIGNNDKFSTQLGSGFDFYPFSNEKSYDQVIQQLQETKVEPTKKLRVALLFGESHILSMLSPLSNVADVIILADIEPKLHQHTQHMLKCLQNSENIEEYLKNYKKDNPIQSLQFHHVTLTIDQIADQHFFYNKSLVGKNYFLTSEEVFSRNKESLNEMDIIHINLNLGDTEQCTSLAKLIKTDGELVLCNFTNIHDYFKKDKIGLSKSIQELLSYSPQCKIMYANGFDDGEPGEYLKANLVDSSLFIKNILKSNTKTNELGLFSVCEYKKEKSLEKEDNRKDRCILL